MRRLIAAHFITDSLYLVLFVMLETSLGAWFNDEVYEVDELVATSGSKTEENTLSLDYISGDVSVLKRYWCGVGAGIEFLVLIYV